MKILVVDDDEYIKKVIVKILENEGHEMFTAENGIDALKKLENIDEIELVITDIIMPEKEGIETILDIKRLYKSKRIIAMSGGGKLRPDGYLLLAKKFGADDILEKPFDNLQLINVVNQFV